MKDNMLLLASLAIIIGTTQGFSTSIKFPRPIGLQGTSTNVGARHASSLILRARENKLDDLKSSIDNNDQGTDNPFSFLSSMFSRPAPQAVLSPQELRQIQLDEGEIRRQTQVSKDSPGYLLLFALQFLPLLGTDRWISFAYFLGTAITTVYVGGRQEVIDAPETISRDNALTAPITASVGIGFLYLLLKFGIDPTLVYAVVVTVFGALAIGDVGVPILRNIVPDDEFGEKRVAVPSFLRGAVDSEDFPLDGLVTLGVGIAFSLVYWAPIAMTKKFVISNVIAWSIAMVSLGTISLGSFQTGAILLGGLFAYDIFWVFGTDVMMTVATKVEAPIKFLFLAAPSEERVYPFSVLGLGDVVIPGLFVRFMTRLDQVLKPQALSYFDATAVAYAVGLSVCFAANEITHSGQPALLYLDPACIGSALAAGALNGQLKEVWNFEEEPVEEEEGL